MKDADAAGVDPTGHRFVLLEDGLVTTADDPRAEFTRSDDGVELGPVSAHRRDARPLRVPLSGLKPSSVALADKPVLAEVSGGRAWVYRDQEGCWAALTTPHLRFYELTQGLLPLDAIADEMELSLHDAQALAATLLAIEAIRILELETFDPNTAQAAQAPTPPPVRVSQRALSAIRRRLDRRPAPPDTTTDTAVESAPPADPGHAMIPVLSFWATSDGPHLGSASVVAYARTWNDGVLTDRYDFRRATTVERTLATVAATDGPVVLLCSNYLWSLQPNLEVVRAAQALNPLVIAIHGGPSTPRYDPDALALLTAQDGVHVGVVGEGEVTFVETLTALLPALDAGEDPRHRLGDVLGLRYLDPVSGALVVTGDRPRHPELADFPSPLTTGELDDVPLEVLNQAPLPVETNRGCPYGCTFCDWGQATMSRVRMFPIERVRADFEWLANRRVRLWVIADANFGMFPRDEDVAEAMIAVRERTGFPEWIAVAPPKNTMRRFVRLIDRLLASGISMKTALALQTRNAETLAAIDRENIGTGAYDDLAIELRQRGLPLTCDLMVGLPGATIDSLADDLQWCIDQQARAFLFPTFVLPNAPMNHPEYRAEHDIVTQDGLIVATRSFNEHERHEMARLSHAYVLFEGLGVLRHVLRYLQWDHDLRAIDVIRQILRTTDLRPMSYPLTTWLLAHADVMLLPTIGWRPFFDEIRQLVVNEFDVADESGLHTAIEANRFVLPWAGRVFPDSLALPHDYVAYYHEADVLLARTGTPSRPSEPLTKHGPGTIVVHGDPDHRCEDGLRRIGAPGSRPGFVGDFWITTHLELLSDLSTSIPLSPKFVEAARAHGLSTPQSGAEDPEDSPLTLDQRVSVHLRRRPTPA